MTQALGWIGGILCLISYALEYRGRAWTLVYALACAILLLYGLLLAQWPIVIMEIAWIAVALHRWRLTSPAQ